MKNIFLTLFVFYNLHTTNISMAQTWNTPVIIESSVGTGGSIGQYTSMAIVNGKPAIAFYDVTRQNLVYMVATDADGLSWNNSIVIDAPGNVGQYASLTIVNGNPAIAYFDATNTALKFVRALDADGTVWGLPISVESVGTVGEMNTNKE